MGHHCGGGVYSSAGCVGRHWRLMTPPQHLFFFTRKSLTTILAGHDMRIVECFHPWKHVPVGLAAYQVLSRLGLSAPRSPSLSKLSIRVNLYDAILMAGRRQR